VGSPNHTTIYIPVGANGVPLVSAVGWHGKDVAERGEGSARDPGGR